MTTLATETRRMAGRKKENFERGRVELMAEPKWIARANTEAERLGMSLSAFIRMVVTQYLDKAEDERAARRVPVHRKP